MQEEITITTSAKETSELGQQIAKNLKGGEIHCLTGELGAGKTTFTQGLLNGLGAQGPYTSPTFNIMKEYETSDFKIVHIDAYRIGANDLLELGFNDFAGKDDVITIIEWPENVKAIIPEDAMRIQFEWLDENQRKITFTKN
jgi:tRNA threonylcarbamoyladenosine biosynthesis protein TsaE